MTTHRSTPSTSWTLLAVLAGALAATACKKDAQTRPPEASGDLADARDARDDRDDDQDSEPELLTVDLFEETVQARSSDVTDCFATAREAKPGLAGKLAFDFTIDGEGKVSELKPDPASTLKDEGLNKCVDGKARGWSFPKTRDGQPMTLPYSFNLS